MAVVGHEGKWVFIHIPKSGGHAIHRFLGPFLRQHDEVIYGNEIYGSARLTVEMHSPARDIRAWLETSGREWDHYLSFAVLRDPVDRMLSQYWEIRRSRHRSEDFWWNRASQAWWETFDRCSGVNAFVMSDLMDPYGEQPMLRPQHWYVEDGGEVIVKRFLFRETMAKDLADMLGFEGVVPSIHVRPPDPEPLTPQSIKRIRALYVDDFDLIREVTS